MAEECRREWAECLGVMEGIRMVDENRIRIRSKILSGKINLFEITCSPHETSSKLLNELEVIGALPTMIGGYFPEPVKVIYLPSEFSQEIRKGIEAVIGTYNTMLAQHSLINALQKD